MQHWLLQMSPKIIHILKLKIGNRVYDCLQKDVRVFFIKKMSPENECGEIWSLGQSDPQKFNLLPETDTRKTCSNKMLRHPRRKEHVFFNLKYSVLAKPQSTITAWCSTFWQTHKASLQLDVQHFGKATEHHYSLVFNILAKPPNISTALCSTFW